MAILAAPLVRGPVLTTSPVVRVDGVLDGADVVVTATDGTEHATGTATANGYVWLTVTEPLREGTTLVAAQSRAGESSHPSSHGTPVLPPPDPVPAPVFGCVLNQCSTAVLLSGLVPGATVTIDAGSTVLATHDVSRSREWVPISSSPGVGDRLRASQTVPGVGAGPASVSEPVTSVDIEQQVRPPRTGPLTACQSEIGFAGAVPSARVTIEYDDGSTSSWFAPDTDFRAVLNRRLHEGEVRVRQTLTGCEFDSDDAVVTVGPETPPPPPKVWWFCPESRRISVDGLLAGATVEFSTTPRDSGGFGPETALMVGGAVGGGRQEFELPHVVGGGPGPIVYVRVRQRLCTLVSDYGDAREYPRPGEGGFAGWPPPKPQIVRPVYSCARAVRVEPSGWGIGTVRSRATGRQLADSFHPLMTLPVVVPLWFPLLAGDELVVEYAGCGAPPESDPAPVSAVPDRLPDLDIVPPLPGDTDLVVSGALPGASVVALLDRRIWSMRTAVDGTARLPLPRALQEGDLVWAYQRLCGSRGNDENSIEVRPGTLDVTVAPATLTVGQPTPVTVTARRSDTGEEVPGLPVSLSGVPITVTGTAISLRMTAPGVKTGTVSAAPRFADGSFTLTAVEAPPPPPQGTQLTLQLGPVGGFGNPVQISSASWRVQPTWSAPAVTASGPTASVALPAPAGSSPRAEIYLDELTGVRWDGGVPFALHLNAPSPVAIVALTSSSLHVGFLLTTEFWPVYDDEGELEGYRWVAVVRFQGVA